MGEFARIGRLFFLALVTFTLFIRHAYVYGQADADGPASWLLITEVFYDSAGADETDEWVEIANLGDAPAAIDGYGLGDATQPGSTEAMLRFPPGSILPAGRTLIVAQSAQGYRKMTGLLPDFEVSDSEPTVPDMQLDRAWANGRFALANDGDDLLLLDAAGQIVDGLSYGDQQTIFRPAIPRAVRGQSLARVPAACDTDLAVDWLAQQRPTPGQLPPSDACREGETGLATAVGRAYPPIGAIQGPGAVSPLLNQLVTFEGVVTGMMEDQNAAGTVYYTLFVQDPPALTDGDAATSDGIAVFLGRQRPSYEIGQRLLISGQVTEFYGLTEVDDYGLSITPLAGGPVYIPAQPLLLPAAGPDRAAYLEAREGMLVSALPEATVFGPTHPGCGFAVAATPEQLRPTVHNQQHYPLPVVLVQNASDVDCATLPQLAYGDQVTGITGPLTYHFDQYKIVLQQADAVHVAAVSRSLPEPLPLPHAGQVRMATFNLHDYLAATPKEVDDAERPTVAALAAKRQKVVYTISQQLACPALVALQEVETAALLVDLAAHLAPSCGFVYDVSHVDGPDARGIDVSLLTNPQRVDVTAVTARQTCTDLPTELYDPSHDCPPGQSVLFSRPPLEVDLLLDNEPLRVWVVHFKSKRGGAVETAPRRLAQAAFLRDLAATAVRQDAQARLVLLGDINDYDGSAAWQRLLGGRYLIDTMKELPEGTRYSYVFDGAAQLIDGIFVSPALLPEVANVTILHSNADYPAGLGSDLSPAGLAYRASDHDIPVLTLGQEMPPVTPEVPIPAKAAATVAPKTPAALQNTPQAAPDTVFAVTLAPTSLPAQTPVSQQPTGEPSLALPAFALLAGCGLLALLVTMRKR